MDSIRLSLVDTHAHLCSPEFDHDRDEVLARAKAAGVEAVIAVGETLADAEQNLDLAEKFPMVKPAAGLYPTFLDRDQAEKMHAFIRSHRAQLAAIGEVGLDHWAVKEEADRELQCEVFKGFIRLSQELGLPLNVHSRSAGRHVVAMLLEEGATRVQLHVPVSRRDELSGCVEYNAKVLVTFLLWNEKRPPQPRTSTLSCYIESFNGKFRDEVLNPEIFYWLPVLSGSRAGSAKSSCQTHHRVRQVDRYLVWNLNSLTILVCAHFTGLIDRGALITKLIERVRLTE